MIDEKKQQLLEFFKYLDPNFFKNFKELLEKILETKTVEYTEEEIIDEITTNQDVDPNIIVNDCCDFFSRLNPQYGEMARNIIRDPEQIKFRCITKKVNSHKRRVDFNQNWNDICILSHELTHNFVLPTMYMDRANQCNLITELLIEVPSIIVELLSEDYLLEKRNIDIHSMEKLRIYNLIDVRQFFYDENGHVIEGFQGIVDLIQDNSNVTPELESLVNNNMLDDFNFSMIGFLNSYTYVIGILIASYIYQKIKENPENIQMFDSMLTIIAKGFAYPEECIQLLEQMGIPIVNDGMFSLTKENMAILYDSYFKTYGEYYSSKSMVN